MKGEYMMFTIYHAVAFVAAFALGASIGYFVGHADGENDALGEVYDAQRRRRRAAE